MAKLTPTPVLHHPSSILQLQLQSQLQFQPQFHRHQYPSFSFSALSSNSQIFRSPWRRRGKWLVSSPRAAISSQAQGTLDPDLRSVLELATDSELYELERILFGTSYFSPLLKSITKPADLDYYMIEEDLEERDDFISILESRFLFLAADARSTLRGWRPSYRSVLLGVRKKLNIPCSRRLSTEDLEAEIFLHLLQEYSSHESGTFPSSWESSKTANNHGSLEFGLSQWKVQAIVALRAGAAELNKMIVKGGGMLTLGKVYDLFARKLLGKMFLEIANYQIRKEVIKKEISFLMRANVANWWGSLFISLSLVQTLPMMHAPRLPHFESVCHILRYLKQSLVHGLLYRPSSLSVTSYCNADWAGSHMTCCSTSGFCTFVGIICDLAQQEAVSCCSV